ncbi:MAG TPA: TROVE domain-containing protein, partial [Alphaproteobacteria bacterium]|nr:TROVE domain-containing protein [Alphaproteobacteria bacterium]
AAMFRSLDAYAKLPGKTLLLIAREMARLESHKGLVAGVLAEIVQRPDELAEFLAIYWKDTPDQRKREKLSAQVKKGLARAFAKFDAYQLAKWNRDGNAVALRDVLFLVHAKPKDDGQAAVWKQLADGTLDAPDTWEVALSAGADKKATFERLLAENKLGAMALLANLRGMLAAGVDLALIRAGLARMKTERIFPYRFITAARHAPSLEPELEAAMFRSLDAYAKLPGKTLLLIDVSGSMGARMAGKSQATRLEAACGLAVLAREMCESVEMYTFSNTTVQVPKRRGFALRDAIVNSQPHGGTMLGAAVETMNCMRADRLIVFTDEQAHDPVPAPKAVGYMINVASYERGVASGDWRRINGFSEAVMRYVAECDAAA